MTWFRWWHKHTRTLFKPKSPETAEKWTGKLSLLYVFLAWNALGMVIYKFKDRKKTVTLTDEQRKNLSPGQQQAIERGDTGAKIIRLDGFRITVIDPVPNPETQPVDEPGLQIQN